MIQFLYSFFSSFWSFTPGISWFSLFSLFQVGGRAYSLFHSSYFLFLIIPISFISSIGSCSICSTTFRQYPQVRLTPRCRLIGDNLLGSSFLPLAQISIILQLEQSTVVSLVINRTISPHCELKQSTVVSPARKALVRVCCRDCCFKSVSRWRI